MLWCGRISGLLSLQRIHTLAARLHFWRGLGARWNVGIVCDTGPEWDDGCSALGAFHHILAITVIGCGEFAVFSDEIIFAILSLFIIRKVVATALIIGDGLTRHEAASRQHHANGNHHDASQAMYKKRTHYFCKYRTITSLIQNRTFVSLA
ncbi:MAG: hypothetical protein EBV03_07940 [Proteobacteria bacterium]|nr:hypothetical protein [Pseudomonadota bacterium]